LNESDRDMKVKRLKMGSFMGETIQIRSLNGFTLSITEHSENMDVPNHEHEFPYISYLMYGKYHEKSIINEHYVAPGASLFRPGGFEHINEIGNAQSLCFNLEIEKNIFDDEIKKYAREFMLFENNNIEIVKILLGFKRNFSEELLSLYVQENLYHLLGRYNLDKKIGRAVWVGKIKKMVRLNPEITYSIEDLANSFRLNPVYLVRKFKESTGLTFGEFLIRQRLARAIDLMHTTSKKLTGIAIETGFYDQSHFIRHFKNEFEISPSHYRKIVKG